jgi:hypothetical protein
MPFTQNQEPIQTLAADASDPSLADRVGPRRADRCLDDSAALAEEHLVESRGELGVAIVDEELHRGHALAQVHDEVPGLLHYPWPGRVGRHSGQMDTAVDVLNEEHRVQPGTEHRLHVEEVGGDDASGLGGEELLPGRPRTARCGTKARPNQDHPHSGR